MIYNDRDVFMSFVWGTLAGAALCASITLSPWMFAFVPIVTLANYYFRDCAR